MGHHDHIAKNKIKTYIKIKLIKNIFTLKKVEFYALYDI
jgi:hypothetical protein